MGLIFHVKINGYTFMLFFFLRSKFFLEELLLGVSKCVCDMCFTARQHKKAILLGKHSKRTCPICIKS